MSIKQAKQYLLVGLPYSGKTTLAKRLQERLGFVHINIDQLKFDRGYATMGDDDVPDEIWEGIFMEADNLLVKYLSEGKNVANEYAWFTREWRDKARKVAKNAGFETKVIYIYLPREVIQKRWIENSKSKKRFHWPENEFQTLLTDFEQPTPDEDILLYTQTIPLEKWIEQNIIS